MQTFLIIMVLILAVVSIRLSVRLADLEKKSLGAFKLICDEVRINKDKLNAYISRLGSEEDAE